MDSDDGAEIAELLDEDCTECGHAFNKHVLVATMVTSEHGGLVFCPERGCLCQSTWSLENSPEPYIPDDDTVAALRRMVQEEEPGEDGEGSDPN